MTRDTYRWAQHCANMFLAGRPVGTHARYANLHYTPLTLDGKPGPRSRAHFKLCRYYLCVGHKDWTKNSSKVTRELIRAMKNPPHRLRGESRLNAYRRRQCASRRRAKRVKRLRPPAPSGPVSGVRYMDGKAIVAWIQVALVAVRKHGTPFYVTSGYRTPAYSQSLCYRMCGRPSCPGLCAGTSSNHTRLGYHMGAVDTTNGPGVRWKAQSLGYPLHNNLPRDLVHSSYNGY